MPGTPAISINDLRHRFWGSADVEGTTLAEWLAAGRTADDLVFGDDVDADISTHEGAANPHPTYTTAAELEDRVALVVGASPDLLNTIEELANALADDENFAATMVTALAAKLSIATFDAHKDDATNVHGVTDMAAFLTSATGVSSVDIRTGRVAIAVVPAAGNTVVTFNFDPDFANVNYTILAFAEPTTSGSDVRVTRITNRGSGSCAVRVYNSELTDQAATIHFILIHDSALT